MKRLPNRNFCVSRGARRLRKGLSCCGSCGLDDRASGERAFNYGSRLQILNKPLGAHRAKQRACLMEFHSGRHLPIHTLTACSFAGRVVRVPS